MAQPARALVGLVAASFVLVVVTNFSVAVGQRRISRAFTHLALPALALVLCFRCDSEHVR